MRLFLGAVLLSSGLASGGAPVAFVADINGTATIEGNGKLTFLAELNPGTRLLLGSKATAAITYAATGTEYSLAGPGQFLVTADEVTAERGTKPKRRTVTALSDGQTVKHAAQTATASLRMRGIGTGAAAVGLQVPVSTRVSTLKPAMRWLAEPGEEYTLVVSDPSGREVWKGRAKEGAARPGATLSAGTRYTWTVTSARGPIGEASFETLPVEAIKRAERSRAAARSFPDRVMNALLLQEVGAQQEARDAWAELARERPDLPELPALAR